MNVVFTINIHWSWTTKSISNAVMTLNLKVSMIDVERLQALLPEAHLP